jgi:monoamine oxidase
MRQKTARIAIIGAGIAGLAAALTLQDDGIKSTLYEASDRVGGRIHSDTTTWEAGLVSEWCGEFIDSNHTTILQLIERFGLSTQELEQEQQDNISSVLFLTQKYVTADELVRNLQELTPLLRQQLQTAGYPTTYDHFTAAGYRLDHMSVHEWIEQYVRGGHTTPLGRYMDATCQGLYGLDTNEQSALNLVYLFGQRDQSQKANFLRPLQGSRKIIGGNEQLPLALTRTIPHECIHLRHQLAAIARSDDNTVHLTFATTSGSKEVVYDKVILALPFSTLRQVDYQKAGFDSRKKQAIEQLGYGTISKLFLQFDQPYWQASGPWPHPNTGFIITDLGIQVLWDASLGQQKGPHIMVDYIGGSAEAAFVPNGAYTTAKNDAAIEQYAQECLLHLEQIFPGISAHYLGRAALSYPTGDPYLLGSYSCWRTGQYTLFGGYERVSQGSIYFAGEHCSISYQGYMEGAAREGIRAAHEVMQAS